MTPTYDVIVAGDYCLDLIFTGLPKLPALGEEIFSTGFEMLPGGSYNTAVAMHRLEMKVGWAADFGTDGFSNLVHELSVREGLDTSLFVQHDQSLRHITVAASYPHERAFISFMDPSPAVPAAVKALAIATAKIFYVPGLYYGSAFEVALSLIRLKRMKLVMDGNLPEKTTLQNSQVKRSIQSVDIFMPNADEARLLTGENELPDAIRKLGELCRLVVVKDGPRGAYGLQDGNLVHAEALPVKVLDTTGAGDCFNAGFIKAWLAGARLEECLKWGNIVGGLSTQAAGGTGRKISLKDVEQYLGQEA